MFTQRNSNSAVCGYSSLSTMFLSNVSAISAAPSGSIQVVTNVARVQPRVAIEDQLIANQPRGDIRRHRTLRDPQPRHQFGTAGLRMQGIQRHLLVQAVICLVAVKGHGTPFPGS